MPVAPDRNDTHVRPPGTKRPHTTTAGPAPPAPSIWTAYRTHAPSGVAAATWALIGLEAALWGVYGIVHGDPAISAFAVIGSVAAAAILGRKFTTRHRQLALA